MFLICQENRGLTPEQASACHDIRKRGRKINAARKSHRRKEEKHCHLVSQMTAALALNRFRLAEHARLTGRLSNLRSRLDRLKAAVLQGLHRSPVSLSLEVMADNTVNVSPRPESLVTALQPPESQVGYSPINIGFFLSRNCNRHFADMYI